VLGPDPSGRAVLEFDLWIKRQQARYPWLATPLLVRYARAYGTRMDVLLAGRKSMGEMGGQIVPGLYEAEASYLVAHEWASSAADILWRRSKLGLHLPPGSARQLDAWLGARRKAQAGEGAGA
jgi:glycerol-3-phosphate dehydrogenase